jgi:superfamily II DNA helicase RecQ
MTSVPTICTSAKHAASSGALRSLTATATPRVQDDIIQLLGLAQAERIITGFNRPNLRLSFSTPDVKARNNF